MALDAVSTSVQPPPLLYILSYGPIRSNSDFNSLMLNCSLVNCLTSTHTTLYMMEASEAFYLRMTRNLAASSRLRAVVIIPVSWIALHHKSALSFDGRAPAIIVNRTRSVDRLAVRQSLAHKAHT